MAEPGVFNPPEPLRSAFAACRRHFVLAACFSALINLLYLTPTIYLMQVYDRVLPTGGMLTLAWISLLAIAAYAALGLLSNVRGRILVRASLRLERLIAPEVLDRLFGSRAENIAGDPSRRLRILRDFDSLRQTITGPGFSALMDVPWTPIYLLVSFLLHPLLGILGLVSSAALIAMALLNEKAIHPMLRKANEVMAEAHISQDGMSRRADVVRALGMRRALGALQLGKRLRGVTFQARAGFMSGDYSNVIKSLRMILQSAVLGLAVYLAVKREISPGAIIAASLLMGRAMAPIDQMVGAWGGIIQGREAYRSLVGLFTEMPQRAERMALPAPRGRIEVSDLGVTLPPDRELLNSVSFSLQPGELVGVVGPSGSGKTTLLSAIAGARAHTHGSIRIDGASVDDWDPDRLARFMGYLPQDSGLLAGSVRDNISRFSTYDGAQPADVDAEVVRAASKAGAHEMILQLPGGYDAILGPGGQGVSAGQAQRIALARALYGDPILLLLDEPNAHLDPEGQMALMNALKDAKARGAAVILAAHRTNALAFADYLMVMRGGKVEAFGPTDEIVKRMRPPGPAPVQGQPVQ